MTSVFVDANVFLRLFAGDDPVHEEKASKLFTRAREGKVRLVSGPPVLFEVAWTLGFRYRQPEETVLKIIAGILATPGLDLLDHDRASAALKLARDSTMSFADAYIAVSTRDSDCDALATFNRADFKKSGVTLIDL